MNRQGRVWIKSINNLRKMIKKNIRKSLRVPGSAYVEHYGPSNWFWRRAIWMREEKVKRYMCKDVNRGQVVWRFCEVLRSNCFSLMGSCSMMSCCSTSSPCWPAWSAWWQCSLCLPAAPASTSRPSPSSQTQRKQTLLRHLSHNGGRVNIGKRGLYAGDRKFDQFQISWPPFTTCLLQPDF